MARTSPLFLRFALTSALIFAMAIAIIRADGHPIAPHTPVHLRAVAAAAALDQRQSGRASRQRSDRGNPAVTPATRVAAPRPPAILNLGPAQRVWQQIWSEMLRASRGSW